MPQNHTRTHTDDSRPAITDAHTHDRQHIRTYLRRQMHTHMHISTDSTLRAHICTQDLRVYNWLVFCCRLRVFLAAIHAGKVAQRTPHCERRPSGPASAGVRQAHSSIRCRTSMFGAQLPANERSGRDEGRRGETCGNMPTRLTQKRGNAAGGVGGHSCTPAGNASTPNHLDNKIMQYTKHCSNTPSHVPKMSLAVYRYRHKPLA